MTFSLAAIPLPVLVGVPVVGLVAGIVYYEYRKRTAAAAAATPSAAATTPASASAEATAPAATSAPTATPTGGVYLPAAARVAVSAMALAHAVPIPGKPGEVLLPITMAATRQPTRTAPATQPSVLLQAQADAQQLLATLPSPFPGDSYGGLYEQITHAALLQYIDNPTQTQFNTTYGSLQQAAQSSGLAPVQQAFAIFQRYNTATAAQ